MKSLFKGKMLVALVFACMASYSIAQSELEATKNTVLQKILRFEGNDERVYSDSSSIVWHQIDTFKYVRCTSAIRGVLRHDTLEISLHFESEWDDSTVLATKQNNTRLIEKHKVKFIHYMDSIDWRGYKISRDWFKSEPVLFLKMNYPRIFDDAELEEIDLIRRCPNFRVGSIGVFLEHGHTGIDPVEVQSEFLEKLRFISEDVFELEEIVYDAEIYE